MIKATAPGGFAIIGDPADMFGGSIISCAVRERAHCALDDSPLLKETTIEVDGRRAAISSPADLQLEGDSLDLPKAVLAALEVLSTSARPFSLSAYCSPGLNDALGGRTALLTSVAGCVLQHLGVYLNVYETAELVRRIETDLLDSPCGYHAQYAAAFGGLCYMDFRGKECATPQEQDAPFATIEPISAYIGELPVVIASGVNAPRGAVGVHAESQGAELCGKLTRLSYLAKKALLAEQWETLGDLLNQSDVIQCQIDERDRLSDELIQTALGAGAIGARRLTGGGGVLALTLDAERTADAFKAVGTQTIHFPALSRGLTVEITA